MLCCLLHQRRTAFSFGADKKEFLFFSLLLLFLFDSELGADFAPLLSNPILSFGIVKVTERPLQRYPLFRSRCKESKPALTEHKALPNWVCEASGAGRKSIESPSVSSSRMKPKQL